jgi:formate hydrogenlyase subunit 4
MRLAVNVAQLLLLVLAAPALRGLIAKLKAHIQRRQGASILRPYADLLKLFRKEDLVPPTASPIFRIAPVVGFATALIAAAFIPVLSASSLLELRTDFFIFVYLLALGRFFVSLGALDGGSSFGGLGGSREALVSVLAEAPLLLALTSLAVLSRSLSIAEMARWTVRQNFFELSPVHLLAFAALAIVAVAETGRMPVDNPTTHLELTMLHEAMVLEYSGPSLALIEWVQAIKLHVISALLIALFLPWGISTTLTAGSMALALLFYCVKITFLAAAVALVESSVAKLRMYAVPDFLRVASALAILAVIFTVFIRK